MTLVAGLPTARGLACGPVFVYRGDGDIPVPEYIVEQGAEDAELRRLDGSIEEIKRDLDGMIAALRERTGRQDLRVFECHLMILEDAFLIDEIEKKVKEERMNAEAAVKRVFAMHRSQFEKMNDSYFRERVRDLDDVERRLLKSLIGDKRQPHLELKSPSIVIADDLTPSETVQLPRENVLGFATNGGSTTSHVALLARALSIPAVTGLVDITHRVTPGETVLLDGSAGTLTLNPDIAARTAFEDQMRRERSLTGFSGDAPPAGTLKDGGDVKIYANVHPGVPFDAFREKGARGIGLYRSEFLWLNRQMEPTEDEQYADYSAAVRFASTLGPDATITIRVLDIGGDKLVDGVSAKENNPFLGNRSIRYLLSHRDVFRRQLRAILRASSEGRVRIMYPMVSCIEELRAARDILERVKAELRSEGIPFAADIPVGAMIEVPSAALCAEELSSQVDFFSVGTNDLVQYTMAADRGNDAVAYLYQPMNRAVLRLMRMSVAAAKSRGIPISVCGESAADPIVGTYWAAIGVDTLSMSATYIGVMSKVLSCLTRTDLDEYAAVPDALAPEATAKEIFLACRAWMQRRLPELSDLLGKA
ncbi:MAG: phosphoenolpyruvate--protein phosphotransferase [Kiritimatiellae bacterium]|nr:phosphoenolpyruvate--protein phosphotransferase [Kiritimatiellia bacterium]